MRQGLLPFQYQQELLRYCAEGRDSNSQQCQVGDLGYPGFTT